MSDRYRLTDVETVREAGSWLFTARDGRGDDVEVFLVPCETDGDADDASEAPPDPVRAWVNSCTHEAQRLYRDGIGAIVRDGEVVCPKHGSLFDTCTGYCDNGEAARTTLVDVAVTVEDGSVFLTDEDYTYLYEGPVQDDEDDDGPSSTSHIQL